MQKDWVLNIILIFCSLSFVSCATTAPLVQTKILQGHWVGRGDIMATWCNHDHLDFDIYIDDGGRVKGKIGDARISDGHVYGISPLGGSATRGSYLIRAHLRGFLIRDEKIARDSVSMTFNLVNDSLEGEMHTSGARCGARGSRYLKVANILLDRSDE